MKCQMCDEPVKVARALIDSGGTVAGIYCSKACAENDAWGPRFRPFSTRRATRADLAKFAPA